MSNVKIDKSPAVNSTITPSFMSGLKGKLPKDTGIFIVMVGIALIFEVLGWFIRDQSFLLNPNRLLLIILQVAIIGIIAVGVTQVIITTGIDLFRFLNRTNRGGCRQLSANIRQYFPYVPTPIGFTGGDSHYRRNRGWDNLWVY